jgi:hypothetical protein
MVTQLVFILNKILTIRMVLVQDFRDILLWCCFADSNCEGEETIYEHVQKVMQWLRVLWLPVAVATCSPDATDCAEGMNTLSGSFLPRTPVPKTILAACGTI